MAGTIKFSIIITNHNYELYLPDCIDSALEQTWPACEVIAVDDGSTDGSCDILSGYADKCRIISQSRGGQGSAMQAGYQIATGDYILFLDADDYLYKDALSVVAHSLVGKEAAKVHFALDSVNADGEVFGRIPRADQTLSSGDLLAELLESGTYVYPPCSGNVFSREVLDRIIPEMDVGEYRICADLFLLLKCVGLGQVLAIETSLGAYRVHGDNAYGVTRILELDEGRLRRRMEALDNKLTLLNEECARMGYRPSSSQLRRWVGLFGYKDRIVCMKFFPGMLDGSAASLMNYVWDFLLLLIKSKKATLLDKAKGVVFALIALGPKCLLRAAARNNS